MFLQSIKSREVSSPGQSSRTNKVLGENRGVTRRSSQGGVKAVEKVMSRLLMAAVADVSQGVRQTVLAALVETDDLDAYLAQAEW